MFEIFRRAPPVFFAVSLLVLLFGAWLRFGQLDHLAPFVDESGHLLVAVDPAVRALVDPIGEGKAGALWVFSIAHAWSSDPLVAARATAAVCGLVTALAIATTLFIYSGVLAALVGFALWMLFPYAVFHERLALLDPFVACFTASALAIATLAGVVSENRIRRLILFGLAGFLAGTACAVKITAVLALPWLILAHLAIQRRFARPWLDRRWLALFGGFLLALLPLGPGLFRLGTVLSQRGLMPPAEAFSGSAAGFATFAHEIADRLPRHLGWTFGYGGWPLAVFLLCSLVFVFVRREFFTGWFIIAWLGSILLASAIYRQAFARYTLADHIPLVLFLGAALAGLVTALATLRFVRVLSIAVLVATFGTWGLTSARIVLHPLRAGVPPDELNQYITGPWSGAGFDEVTRFLVQRRAREHAPVVLFVQPFARPGAYIMMLAARNTADLAVVPLELHGPLAAGALKAAVAKARTVFGPRLAVFVLCEGPRFGEAVVLQAAGVRTSTVLDRIKPDLITGFALLECDLATL